MNLFIRLSMPLLFLCVVAAQGDEPKPPVLPEVITESDESKIARALERPITMDLRQTPLTTSLDFLKDFTGFQFSIDAQGLARAGVKPNQPITMSRKEIPLNLAIDSILSQHRLTYVVEHGGFTITDAEGASTPTTRVYPLADLVIISPEQKVSPIRLMAEQVEIIQNSIDHDNWQELGGTGTITVAPSSLSLVISTSQPNHRRISRLLRDLRESAKATTTWLESKELSREDILSEVEQTKKTPPVNDKPVVSPPVAK